MKVLLLNILSLLILGSAHAGTWTEGSYWSVWGNRGYKVYLPHNYGTTSDNYKLPVVVALHGCMQNPDVFAGGTRLNEWADKLGFAVVYPEQTNMYNIYNCWNWFFPINQSKKMGESQLIMGSIDKAIKQFNFDSKRVYLLGMSAGGAMASVMANCYPERFNAIGTHHATMYKAAEDAFTAEDVVYNGSKLSPEIAAAKGYACSGMIPRRKTLPVVIIHGSRGAVMKAVHATQVETEFRAFNDFLDNGFRDNSLKDKHEIKRITPKDKYAYDLITWSQNGKPYIKRYMIETLGHAWSGGDNQYEFNDQNGPDATKLMLDFFKEYGL
jgi:poly(hydroxyalkanoate) depolymerase family esterase